MIGLCFSPTWALHLRLFFQALPSRSWYDYLWLWWKNCIASSCSRRQDACCQVPAGDMQSSPQSPGQVGAYTTGGGLQIRTWWSRQILRELSNLKWELLCWTHNPDSLISISTVENFEFYAESTWFLDFGYLQILCSLIGSTIPWLLVGCSFSTDKYDTFYRILDKDKIYL